MDILHQHELFEIEVLDKLKSAGVLEQLIFGGGTMLRLCHELNRYSADLDFWHVKEVQPESYFNKIQHIFRKDYEITDGQIKYYTFLFELRSPLYPKRLKVEIRREVKACDFEEKIAFSSFGTTQVLLKAHTLDQMMKNKIEAFLDRGEIRDCYDIEFLLRKGIALPTDESAKLLTFQTKLSRLKINDFKVKLGSILEKDMRSYYIENRFKFLVEKLAEIIPAE